jgi:hypothetical protein|tara:strand:+ start:477 stop:581 length:105 start_codon:yes stop_codon:yes gene_type:complete
VLNQWTEEDVEELEAVEEGIDVKRIFFFLLWLVK